MVARKTSAWPLAQAYAALIVYASLYPFSGWRDQGIASFAFLASPWPRYWTGFDVAANVLGYAPLGFLLALSVLRRGHRPASETGVGRAVLLATAYGAALSLAMEALQTYLPARVPSNVDFGLNAAGAGLGAGLAGALEWAGAVDRWSRFRQRWFVEDARGALVLLALWPFALLFPAAVPLGLGQVLERVEAALGDWLADTPFLEWMPVRDVELQPLVPGVELLCVALGVLVPCLLAYSIMQTVGRRALIAALLVALGVGATALSAALSWGPVHAWAWLSLPVRLGLAVGLVLCAALLLLPRRWCAALGLVALLLHLVLLNQAPASAYFTHTLQAWEQGRFIRFHGLAQWLGWLWPYATLAYVLARVSRPHPAA
ncbi:MULTISPECIES: VanZ family protein [Ramlibacter]|uniref:VanZ family protein n=1 Tax=Ramlibacter pinisoli TaxID=2682844 RepID=A0A6N8J189_9BURK|nr:MULTISPECIES: VanZ family protein [Ramlibacter]MBA2963070.1 VanZ family protein [Ramlibacter sp. CGMCC 1.13660]MVQ33014.1 VanZ family protein [Ramlibacter pinisoli]